MKKAVLVIAALLSAFACVRVQVGDRVVPKSRCICVVDWRKVPDKESADIPGVFDVAAARVFNSEHYLWEQVDTAGSLEPDTLRLYPGEYQWAVFSCDSLQPNTNVEKYYCYNIENLDSFLEDRTVSMRSLYARIPKMPRSYNNYQFDGFESALVGYCDTVTQAPRLICGNLRAEIPQSEDSLLVHRLHFSPEIFSRQVSFRVYIEAEQDVKVNRIIANVVGVPVRVELISGLMDGNRSHLGQTPFEMYYSEEEPGWWSGTVNILGIVPPTSADAVSGAGILQVFLDVGAGHRKIRRVLNLDDYLTRTPLLRRTDVEDWYHGSYGPVTYRILSPIRLDSTGGVSSGDPVNEWKDPEDGETQDIEDGEA